MAPDPEAQTQLARLLRDDSLRAASREELQSAVERSFDGLVDGLVAEAAASDDVFDQESGRGFIRLRIESLQSVLTDEQASRLNEAAQGRIEAW